jgi:hypothetical protein
MEMEINEHFMSLCESYRQEQAGHMSRELLMPEGDERLHAGPREKVHMTHLRFSICICHHPSMYLEKPLSPPPEFSNDQQNQGTHSCQHLLPFHASAFRAGYTQIKSQSLWGGEGVDRHVIDRKTIVYCRVTHKLSTKPRDSSIVNVYQANVSRQWLIGT